MHGSGGFSKCEGTTKEEAIQNCALKESIATNEHIKAFFRWFTLEDGGLVVLDIVHACDHARQCVNDLKRSRVKCPLFSVKKEPSDDKEVHLLL